MVSVYAYSAQLRSVNEFNQKPDSEESNFHINLGKVYFTSTLTTEDEDSKMMKF